MKKQKSKHPEGPPDCESTSPGTTTLDTTDPKLVKRELDCSVDELSSDPPPIDLSDSRDQTESAEDETVPSSEYSESVLSSSNGTSSVGVSGTTNSSEPVAERQQQVGPIKERPEVDSSNAQLVTNDSPGSSKESLQSEPVRDNLKPQFCMIKIVGNELSLIHI